MTELVNAALAVKNPVALFAFLAVILLIAFRTKTVPEFVFKLLSDKISRANFYRLVQRSLVYTFSAFLTLCAIAVLGQVLSYLTTARIASVERLKAEVALRQVDEAAKRTAVEAYEQGLSLAQDNRLDKAIASLDVSLKAVPTIAARETLALLHERAGNHRQAIDLAEELVSEVRSGGHTLDTVRAERLLSTLATPVTSALDASCPPGAGLVGAKLELPLGGDAFETAPMLVPCVYSGVLDTKTHQWAYYKLPVQSGQTLTVTIRSRDSGIGPGRPFNLRLHGIDGGRLNELRVTRPTTLDTLEHGVKEAGLMFVSLNGPVQGSAVELSVR